MGQVLREHPAWTKSLEHQTGCGDEAGTGTSKEVSQEIEIRSEENKWSKTDGYLPGKSTVTSPRLSWEVRPWVRAQISRSHGQEEE